jgi:hypothetical protein
MQCFAQSSPVVLSRNLAEASPVYLSERSRNEKVFLTFNARDKPLRNADDAFGSKLGTRAGSTTGAER